MESWVMALGDSYVVRLNGTSGDVDASEADATCGRRTRSCTPTVTRTLKLGNQGGIIELGRPRRDEPDLRRS